MAGIGLDSGEAGKALRSVERRLDTRYGVVLLQPAFTKYYVNLGEISSYPPGYKENAGIFCHNNPWITCAEAVLGHGDRAFEVYRKTCPAYLEDISEIHRTEPYVYSQMVAGIDAPTFGEGKNSWLTGTAAWTLVSVTQSILGVQPALDGLALDPCVPASLREFTVTRRFRGAVYRIRVENPDGVQHGVRTLYVNGKQQSGTLLSPAPAGSEVDVRVVMYGSVAPFAKEFIAVTPLNPRALPADRLASYLTRFGKPVTACLTVSDGVRAAIAHAGPDGTVLAYGSLYMTLQISAYFSTILP